jgi:hypothetical protein
VYQTHLIIKKYGRQVVAIVVAIYTGGATLAAGWSVWASGAAAGFVSGAISTGSLKGAMQRRPAKNLQHMKKMHHLKTLL